MITADADVSSHVELVPLAELHAEDHPEFFYRNSESSVFQRSGIPGYKIKSNTELAPPYYFMVQHFITLAVHMSKANMSLSLLCRSPELRSNHHAVFQTIKKMFFPFC